jgi:hypothetical protein
VSHDDLDRLWSEVQRVRDRLHALAGQIATLQIRSEEHGRRLRRIEGAGARRWSAWQRTLGLVIVAGGFVLALLHALGVTP